MHVGFVGDAFESPLIDVLEHELNFDGTWYHNLYAQDLFWAFCREHDFEPIELARFNYESGYKCDQIVVCQAT